MLNIEPNYVNEVNIYFGRGQAPDVCDLVSGGVTVLCNWRAIV